VLHRSSRLHHASALALAFAGGFAAHRLGLPPIVGYLLAGVAIGPFTPGFVADSRLAGQLAELGVTLLIDPKILAHEPLEVLAVLAIVTVGKSVAAFAILRAAGYAAATAGTVAAGLAQIGDFSFMLAAIGAARLWSRHGAWT
jgi:CPA2 family monovalent cation:H+ antiporter-2